MIQIYVLNLKRRPDRRIRFSQLNTHQDIKFIWIEALDGEELERSQLVENNLITRRHQHFTSGQLGCALSHRALWQSCLKENKPVLICEDDAILRQDFVDALSNLYNQLPDNWDFVLLGYNFNSILDLEIISGVDLQASFSEQILSQINQQNYVKMTDLVKVFPLNNAFGLCSYLVSPQGAKQLLDLCFPLTGLAVGVPALKRVIQPAAQIDIIMNNHYRRLKAYCCLPPLAITPNDSEDSDTNKS